MNNLVIFPVIFFFLHTSPKLQVNNGATTADSLHTIYLIKQYWHTAVVFKKEGLDATVFPVAEYFRDANLIDIGWGDEKFYQHPGFDSGLAYKALFYSTPSTLRVEGIYISTEHYFDISEIVIELKINNEQLKILLNYIDETLWKDEDGKPEILSEQGSDRIIFFRANGNYHLFNTCNTWLARGLKNTGINIKDDIILTEQLFNEAAKVGRVIKAEK